MDKYDVFISYSSKDRIAFDYCEQLERNGVRCWIAPRNIVPGVPYARAIMQGLTGSDTILVLISRNSLQSDDVLNEIDNAHGLKKNIIPVFIEQINLNPEFSYYLKRKQWIDAFADKGNAVDQILRALGKSVAYNAPQTNITTSGNGEKSAREDNGENYISNWLNSRFDVYLTNTGPSKLAVTKFVKEYFDLSLKEAKDIVDGTASGRVLLTTVDFANEYDFIKEQLDELGASVECHSSGQRKDYDVYLTDAGPSKLAVLKFLKDNFNLSFMEAKDLVDRSGAGRVLITTLDDLNEFYHIKEQLDRLEAKVMFKRINPGIHTNPL